MDSNASFGQELTPSRKTHLVFGQHSNLLRELSEGIKIADVTALGEVGVEDGFKELLLQFLPAKLECLPAEAVCADRLAYPTLEIAVEIELASAMHCIGGCLHVDQSCCEIEEKKRPSSVAFGRILIEEGRTHISMPTSLARDDTILWICSYLSFPNFSSYHFCFSIARSSLIEGCRRNGRCSTLIFKLQSETSWMAFCSSRCPM